MSSAPATNLRLPRLRPPRCHPRQHTSSCRSLVERMPTAARVPPCSYATKRRVLKHLPKLTHLLATPWDYCWSRVLRFVLFFHYCFVLFIFYLLLFIYFWIYFILLSFSFIYLFIYLFHFILYYLLILFYPIYLSIYFSIYYYFFSFKLSPFPVSLSCSSCWKKKKNNQHVSK